MSAYRTILVHADTSRNARERIKIAARIAIREQALLVGTAITGESGFVEQAALVNSYDPGITGNLTAQLQALRQNASDALLGFERIAHELHVGRMETCMVDGLHDQDFGALMRASDLIVLGQNYPDEPSVVGAQDMTEAIVSTSGRPVMIVPYAGQFDHAGSRILIGWDASPCATRAAAFALPLLQHAEEVDVVVFNPDTLQAGEEAIRYLDHHDVKARLERQNIDIDAGNALLSLAADFGSNMLVMGAYGHSRLREMLFGGATRTVLQSATVPVLLSH